jgi:hypothetical protein
LSGETVFPTLSFTITDKSVDMSELTAHIDSSSDTVSLDACPMNGPDQDGDGLGDCSEETYNTDTTDPDTDDDSISDYEELNPDAPYPGSDPLRKDIYVEIDYKNADTTELHEELDPVRDAYANAPVSNPNGEANGITLHTRIDEELDDETSILGPNEEEHGERLVDIEDEYKDYETYKYVAVDPDKDGQSFALPGTVGIVIGEEFGSTFAFVFMHELGHILGLVPESQGGYEGIDSNNVSYNTYPSAMNYNSQEDDSHIKYNDGEPYDDWEAITCELWDICE